MTSTKSSYTVQHASTISGRKNFGSGPFGGDLETLLYSIGGYWPGLGSISDLNSWVNSPYFRERKNPRQVAYNMLSAVNQRADRCLELPSIYNREGGPINGECVPYSSSKSIENGVPSVEASENIRVLHICIFSVES